MSFYFVFACELSFLFCFCIPFFGLRWFGFRFSGSNVSALPAATRRRAFTSRGGCELCLRRNLFAKLRRPKVLIMVVTCRHAMHAIQLANKHSGRYNQEQFTEKLKKHKGTHTHVTSTSKITYIIKSHTISTK